MSELSQQLLALKEAERFIHAELKVREAAFPENPTAQEEASLLEVRRVLTMVQDAVLQGEIAAARSARKFRIRR